MPCYLNKTERRAGLEAFVARLYLEGARIAEDAWPEFGGPRLLPNYSRPDADAEDLRPSSPPALPWQVDFRSAYDALDNDLKFRLAEFGYSALERCRLVHDEYDRERHLERYNKRQERLACAWGSQLRRSADAKHGKMADIHDGPLGAMLSMYFTPLFKRMKERCPQLAGKELSDEVLHEEAVKLCDRSAGRMKRWGHEFVKEILESAPDVAKESNESLQDWLWTEWGVTISARRIGDIH